MDWRRRAGLAALMLLAWSSAAAQIPPAVKFIIGGLNGQLPQKLGNDTTLTRIAVNGDKIDALLVVEPGSPLALGFDVQHEAARLCGVDVFRTLTAAVKAQLHVVYVKPDQTSVGEFTISRAICGR